MSAVETVFQTFTEQHSQGFKPLSKSLFERASWQSSSNESMTNRLNQKGLQSLSSYMGRRCEESLLVVWNPQLFFVRKRCTNHCQKHVQLQDPKNYAGQMQM